jgi:hypothetical protein
MQQPCLLHYSFATNKIDMITVLDETESLSATEQWRFLIMRSTIFPYIDVNRFPDEVAILLIDHSSICRAGAGTRRILAANRIKQ